jgi:hypothetical protein
MTRLWSQFAAALPDAITTNAKSSSHEKIRLLVLSPRQPQEEDRSASRQRQRWQQPLKQRLGLIVTVDGDRRLAAWIAVDPPLWMSAESLLPESGFCLKGRPSQVEEQVVRILVPGEEISPDPIVDGDAFNNAWRGAEEITDLAERCC